MNVSQIVSSLLIAVLSFVAGSLLKKGKGFNEQHGELLEMKRDYAVLKEDYQALKRDHDALVKSQRYQIKNTICRAYEEAEHNGCVISMLALDNLNELADSYFSLGGNHYVKSIMNRLNNDFEIVGELPSE